ncbi:MAG: hypothetical protein WCJ30_08735, partial [Deltaproteobacteria bacterium]
MVAGATLPRFASLFPGSAVNAVAFVALGAAALVYALLFRTRFGYELRAVGLSPTAAVVDRVLERYVALLEGELAQPTQRTRVFPGVLELLAALDERADCVSGLLTGNVRPGARLNAGDPSSHASAA